MEVSFEQLITLIEQVTIVLAFYLMYRSVPSDKVSELLKSAKQYAEQTESELDDTAVSVAQRFFEWFKKNDEVTIGDVEPVEPAIATDHQKKAEL